MDPSEKITNQVRYAFQKDEFVISEARLQATYTMPSKHFHDQYEIYWLIEGERKYFIRDAVYPIQPGMLVFIPAHEIHKTIEAGSVGHVRQLIQFSRSFVAPNIGEASDLMSRFGSMQDFVIHVPIDERPFIHRLFFDMLQEAARKEFGYETACKSLLMQLLVYISRHMNQSISNRSKIERPWIDELVHHLNKNYAQPLHLDELAEKFYRSQWHLGRAFKDNTGLSVNEYIQLNRVRAAKQLLQDTNLAIALVAENCGFGSVSQFHRVFKDMMNCTPYAYRKRNKQL